MQKPKILIFSIAYSPFWGGAEIAVKEITERLSSDFEFDMITLALEKGLQKKEKISAINMYRIGGGKLLFPIMAFLKARKLNKERDYNIVWSIMANRAGFAALFFKLFSTPKKPEDPPVKFLLTLQEGDELNYPKKRAGIFWIFISPFFKMIFKKADFIQAISSFLAEWGISIRKSPDNVAVVPNGVDLDKFKIDLFNKREVRKSFNLKLDDNVIVTTSRLVPKNGIVDLVESIHLFIDKYNIPVKLLILGEGEERAKIESLIKKYKLEKYVFLLGFIPQDKIYDYLYASDIFIRPSLTEGLGNSFLEAMAAGLPVIGTPVGGIPDFLEDGVTGLFCKPRDPENIADAIYKLLSDASLKQKIAQNGQSLVFENYGWGTVSGEMKTIFKRLI
ncbi:MAG: glycosyltransferase family 4 protein [Parcubacteria group bacterium]|nr:glycosyltransferase family 4 protein [Parcubacteria group bacterium]MCR4342782.1 glycosyltransferase family 4 protein [Patescibacteria group bacterium]